MAGRCDRCSAAAVLMATKGEMTLDFCGHHGDEVRGALLAKGWSLVDTRISSTDPVNSPSV